MEAIRLLPYYGPEECERPDRSIVTLEIASILYRWEELTGRKLDAQPLLAFAELWRVNQFRPGVVEVSQTHLGTSLGRTEASARRWLAGIEVAGLGRRIDAKRGPRGGVLFLIHDPVEQCVRWRIIESDGQLMLDFCHDQGEGTFDGTDEIDPHLKYFDGTVVDGTVEQRQACRGLPQNEQPPDTQPLATQNHAGKGERHADCNNISNVKTNVSNISGQFDGTDEIPVTAVPDGVRPDRDRALTILEKAAETTAKLHNPSGLFRWTGIGIQLLQSTPAFTCLGRTARLSEYDIETCIEATNDKQAGANYYCGAVRRRLKQQLQIPDEINLTLPNYAAVKQIARRIGMPWNHKWMAGRFKK